MKALSNFRLYLWILVVTDRYWRFWMASRTAWSQWAAWRLSVGGVSSTLRPTVSWRRRTSSQTPSRTPPCTPPSPTHPQSQRSSSMMVGPLQSVFVGNGLDLQRSHCFHYKANCCRIDFQRKQVIVSFVRKLLKGAFRLLKCGLSLSSTIWNILSLWDIYIQYQ